MSGYTILPNDIWSLPLKSDCKLVFIYLHSFKNAPSIHPTIDIIAKNTGLSWDTVNRSLKLLEKQKLITVYRKHRRPNVYKISWVSERDSKKIRVSDCDSMSSNVRLNRVAECDSIINNKINNKNACAREGRTQEDENTAEMFFNAFLPNRNSQNIENSSSD